MEQIQYNPNFFQQGFQPDQAPDFNVGSAQNQQRTAAASQQIISALSQNSQIEQQNMRRVAEGNQALAKFSQTLAKQVEKKAYEMADNEFAEGLLYAYENPSTLPADGPEDSGAATLNAAGKAEAANASNADVIVPAVRGSRFFQMGVRRGQTMSLLQTQYQPFLQSKIDEAQPKTSQELAVVMANARKEFWAKAPVDRTAMSSKFLTGKVFPAMGKLDSSIATQNRNRILADQSFATQNESFTSFNSDRDVASLLQKLSITTDANGSPLGYKGAWKLFDKNLTNGIANGTYSETDVASMESQPIPGDPKGRTYGQLYGNKFATARLAARKAKNSLWGVEQAERQTAAQQEQQQLLDAFLDPNDADGFTEEQITEAADKLEAANPGFSATKLRNLTKLSVDAQTRKKQEGQIEDLLAMGLLTPERLERFDPKLQAKYRGRAQEQAKLAKENGQYKLQLKTLTDRVKVGPDGGTPIAASADGTRHPSVRLMEDKVHKKFREALARYQVSDPQNAAQLAFDEALNWFNTNAKVGKNGYEGFSVDKNAVLNAKIRADAEIARIDTAIQQDGYLDEANSVFTTGQLQQMAKGYGEPGWSAPASIEYIADKEGVDGLTILNRMLKADPNMQELPPTPAAKIVANELSPTQRRLLKQIGNPEVSQRTMGSLGKFKPELIPNGLGSVVQQAASSAGVPPEQIAALMEIESGFKNDIPSYNGSSFGLMQINRSAHPAFFQQNNWKDPQANANYGAQYYAGLLKQYKDPVAAAMAYNAGPGNYERYLRGELPDGPIRREMLAHGQKFSAALYKYGGGTQALNNPSNLRPVYITGNIGPTSTGPHLDVKQVGRGEFSPTALDDYVEIDDREYGRVPLSKVGVTGDFASHTVRGSHGIDYGTYSGSKVYLKNGAKVVGSTPSVHGDVLTIQLPNGQQYTFLHGKSN